MTRIFIPMLFLLIFLQHCTQSTSNSTVPLASSNPSLPLILQLPAVSLSIAGPMHPQGCEMAPPKNTSDICTIDFQRIGGRAAFFVYDIQQELPNIASYKIQVAQGGVRITCGTETVEHFAGIHSYWLPLRGTERIEQIRIMALLENTRVEIESIQAFAFKIYEASETPPPQSASLPFANADFEQGNLENWQAQGDAFTTQPTFEDNPAYRWGYEGAFPQGEYWIGTFENRPGLVTQPAQSQGDKPRGTLTSKPFVVQHRFLSGLVGGGHSPNCGVSIRIDSQEIAHFTGNTSEILQPFVLDISEYQGRECTIVIVDQEYTGWGHTNADHFCVFGKL